MSDYCVLDRLPVKLVHMLFEYFWAHEIYSVFSDVSDYINSILQSYKGYRINLKLIERDHFDLICRHIRSEQVVSLILSDDIDTYGQSEIFFSRFRIEHLTNLQSLTLIEIDFKLLDNILSNFSKFSQLNSLWFADGSIRYQDPFQMNPLTSNHFTNVNTDVLSKLIRLNYGSATSLTSILFPDLRHLVLHQCSNDELNSIFQHAPTLKSLDVCLNLDKSRSELNSLPKNLTRLSLKIDHPRISMNAIKELLSNMSYLLHLELKISATNDIADGYEWEKLANSLNTFNFRFDLLDIANYDILNSFSTSFWLEEKRWYVAYQGRSLFSIPHFAPVYIESRKLSKIHSTVPNDFSTSNKRNNYLLFDHVNIFTLNTNSIHTNHRFNQITTLNIECSISFQIIERNIDLNRVKHLTIPSVNNLLKFIPLKSKLPQLNKLTVSNSVTDEMIAEIKCYQFEQILQLELNVIDQDNFCILKRLFRLFPSTQHLRCKSYINRISTMIYLIDGFKDLSKASFYVTRSFLSRESNCHENVHTAIIKQSKRLTKNNFLYRIYQSSSHFGEHDVIWRIGENLLTDA